MWSPPPLIPINRTEVAGPTKSSSLHASVATEVRNTHLGIIWYRHGVDVTRQIVSYLLFQLTVGAITEKASGERVCKIMHSKIQRVGEMHTKK